MSVVIFSDFDGTIVDIDTGEYVLKQFAQGDWMALDAQLERGELTLEECLARQFALVKETEETLLKRVDGAVSLRPGLEDLLNYCERGDFPFVVVSGGLDFIIRHVLSTNNLLDRVELVAPKAKVTKQGITFQFPKLVHPRSSNFKDDVVATYKNSGSKTVFIGDGLPDFPAIKAADSRFVIRGSRLSRLCEKEGVAFQNVEDFHDVLRSVTAWGAYQSLR